MNKSDLVYQVASNLKANGQTKVTAKLVNQIIDAALDVIVETVASGDKVLLVDFGSFTKQQRKPRVGRNPATGELITIAAKTVPSFKPGKFFKDSVSGNF